MLPTIQFYKNQIISCCSLVYLRREFRVKIWNDALCALGNLAEGLQIVRYFKENFLIVWILTPSHT